MSYARTRLTLLMLPLLLAAGACADRAENATGHAALNQQLNRAHQPDSASAVTEVPAPAVSTLREQKAPASEPAATTRPVPAEEPAPVPEAARPAAETARPAAEAAPPAAETTRPTAETGRPAAEASGAVNAVAAAGAGAVDSVAHEAEPVPVARTPRTVTMTVPIGAMLSVSLNEELSTRNNHVGDIFTTTLQEPFVQGSTVLLPAGAIIEGRVTAAQQSTRVGRTAVLKLAFDSVRIDGASYPLSATVMEANPERTSRSNTTETAGKIAAGAAAGALLGRILGKDTRSTVAGAAIGAAAGTAIALGTQDVDAVLPRDSRMVIRVDRPVMVAVKVP